MLSNKIGGVYMKKIILSLIILLTCIFVTESVVFSDISDKDRCEQIAMNKLRREGYTVVNAQWANMNGEILLVYVRHCFAGGDIFGPQKCWNDPQIFDENKLRSMGCR